MSVLYVKVSIARRPTSNRPRAIRIVASYHEKVTKSSAQWYCELGFAQLSAIELQSKIRQLAADAKAARLTVKMNRDVEKMLEV